MPGGMMKADQKNQENFEKRLAKLKEACYIMQLFFTRSCAAEWDGADEKIFKKVANTTWKEFDSVLY